MKKSNTEFKSNLDSFASHLESNIHEIALKVGWSPVKEVLLPSKMKVGKEVMITQQINHDDGVRTMLIAEVGDPSGAPIKAITKAVEEIVQELQETAPNRAPIRFVVVAPVISPIIVEMARERSMPVSFLMIDNDKCSYWPAS